MRYFPRPLKILPDEGFARPKDIFNREPLGKGLAGVLQATADPMVIALNGEWGTGKSTFLQMWAGYLRNEGHPVILFDAFAHDYIADPFEALAGEILDLTKTLKPAAAKDFMEVAKSAGKVLIKAGVAFGIRAATAGILDASVAADAIEDAKDAVGDATDKMVEEALESRKKERNTFEAFRKALSELPPLLKETGKPLIFIVDELDRCKPSFALQLLERIKHFFSVPNVHFVLGVQMQQLQTSVRTAYGSDIDAQLYLQKFISLNIDLNVPAAHRHERPERKYIEYLTTELELKEDSDKTLRYTLDFISNLAMDHGFSFRQIEKIMSTLALARAYSAGGATKFAPVVAGLCVMKAAAPVLFRKAKDGTLTFDEFQKFFRVRADNKEWTADFFLKWWRFCLDPTFSDAEAEQMSRSLFHFGFGRTELASSIANSVIDRFALPA